MLTKSTKKPGNYVKRGTQLYLHICQFKDSIELLEWGKGVFYKEILQEKNLKQINWFVKI